MNTINTILKQHSEVFDPHKQLIESIKISRTYLPFIIMIMALLGSVYFLNTGKLLFSLIGIVLFLLMAAIGSILHFKKIERLYGLNNLDLERIKRFSRLVLQKKNINLNIEAENQFIEGMIREQLENLNRLEQAKKSVYLGLATTVLPLLITLVIKNITNVQFLTLIIMGIGLVILFFSLKSVFKEYTKTSKLEHISEILKEIRLSQLVAIRSNLEENV